MYLGIGDLDVSWGPGVYRGPGVKVKVMRWDWDREVADYMYLGIGDLDVPGPPRGVLWP